MAKARKLDVIAITDHNSAENVQATINAANNKNIVVWAGIEITSLEEAHVIALFDSIRAVFELQKQIYDALVPGENNEKLFGQQLIVNELDEIQGYNRRLLIGATSLTLFKLAKMVHDSGGLIIASHIDRESYSIVGQLGFIPEDLEIDAVELSANTTIQEAKNKIPDIWEYPIITSSDAHFLEEIGKVTTSLFLEQPTMEELDLAFRNRDGRKIIYRS